MGSNIVVYLVWAPLGSETAERFVASLKDHPAGTDHELVVLFNGFTRSDQLQKFTAIFDGLNSRNVVIENPLTDLGAFRSVVLEGGNDAYFFCGSYTQFQSDNWLSKFVHHLDQPDVGMVAAGGSYESLLTSLSLPGRLSAIRRFPKFPNPHLRTNFFGLSCELIAQLDWSIAKEKADAWAIENGRKSLYRQVRQRGLAGVVVTADGSAWEESDWPACGAFRSGEQANLIAHDRRSLEYQRASESERRELRRLAWGAAE